MTPDAKIARQAGWVAVHEQVVWFLRTPRIRVGVIISVFALVGVSAAVLGLVGDRGWRAIGVALSAGVIAGILAAFVCVLTWRSRDFPRRDKPPFPDIIYTESYMWSLGGERERARSSGSGVEAAEDQAAVSTSPGERTRILPVLRDRVRRQSVDLALGAVFETLLVPLLFLALFTEVRLWSFLPLLGTVAATTIVLGGQVEAIGRFAQMRDRLERLAAPAE